MQKNNEIGVGPHRKPWPTGSQFDPVLLAEGDRRNVEDKYRYWTMEAIKADLLTHCYPFDVAVENWQHDFNIGTIVRNANAFNAGAVHIIGRRHWNRRGAMVTDRYMDVKHHASVAEFVASTKDKAIVAVDNVPGSQPLAQVQLPRDCVLVFGGEGPGLSEELRNAADMVVAIEQFGSTRSVNVGVAAGIVMYEWLKTYAL